MQCAGMPTFPLLCQSLSLKNLFRCHVSFGKRQVWFKEKALPHSHNFFSQMLHLV